MDEQLDGLVAARQRIRALQAVWESKEDEARRKRSERLMEMAGGDQIKSIRRMPAEPQDHFRDKPKFAPNILGQALTALSYLYDEEPQREMSEESEQEWAERCLWSFGMGLSNSLGYARKVTRLTDVALAFVAYKQHPDAARDIQAWVEGKPAPEFDPEDDGFEVVTIPRHRFCVLTNAMDARHVEAVLVHLTTISTVQENGLTNTRARFHFFDSEYHGVVERDTLGKTWDVLSLNPSGLGVLPFVVMRNVEAGTDFEPELGSWGGEDLERNVRTINEMWTEYLHTAKLQRGQPWVQGHVENLTLAPDAAIKLEADANFGIVSNQADLPGMHQAVTNASGALAKSLGLPSRALTIEHSSAASGVAIALDRAELADDRRSQEPVARHIERQIHRVAATIYNAKRGTSLNGDLMVTFTEPVIQLTGSELREQVQFELDNGLVGKRDALRMLHPELTEEQIDERLSAIEDEKPEPAAQPEQPINPVDLI